jgi:hypothetical protein
MEGAFLQERAWAMRQGSWKEEMREPIKERVRKR